MPFPLKDEMTRLTSQNQTSLTKQSNLFSSRSNNNNIIIITAFIKRQNCSKALYIKRQIALNIIKSKTKLKQMEFIKQGKNFKKVQKVNVQFTARNAIAIRTNA